MKLSVLSAFGRLNPCLAVLLAAAGCTGFVDGGSDGVGPAGGPGGPLPGQPGTAGGPPGESTGGPLPTDPDGVATACEGKAGVLATGRTPLRRLTRAEIDTSVRALLQVDAEADTSVTPDEKMGPFYSNAIAPVDELAVEQYQELAARAATAAAPRMAEIAGCDLAVTGCAATFIDGFGLRAYRRPVDATEKAALLAVFEAGKAAGDVALGFRSVVEAMLQSPFFLYHDDTYSSVAAAPHPSAAPLAIDPYVAAARLAFFLTGTTPDAELLAAAAAGELRDATKLTSHATRLLQSEAAGETVGMFHRQWLGVSDVAGVDRDVTRFPAFSPELAAAAYAETKAFTNYVLRQGDGKLSTLLTSNVAFPQGKLFEVYGVAQPSGYQPGSPVELDPTRRAGLLTQAAFLMRHAHSDQTSPVHRGILVRENLLCGSILPPPPGIVVALPPVSPATSTRERFAQHVADPVCASCHRDIDPLGLGFEHYDAVGGYRTVDGMGPVDATGAFTNVRADLEGTFQNAVEMTQALAKSAEVADCVSRQWFRFALGRVESFDDACTVMRIQTIFAESGGSVPGLLQAIVQSEAFSHVRSSGGNQ
jgi:hypothetical protein